MSVGIIYRDNKIAFSRSVTRDGYAKMRTSLEYLVCSRGLVIPYSAGSFTAVRILDGLRVDELQCRNTCNAIVMRLDGSFFRISANYGIKSEHDQDEVPFTVELPYGEGVFWGESMFDHHKEKISCALALTNTIEETIALCVKADVYRAKDYIVHDVPELLEKVKEIHRGKYPELYTEGE